MNYFIWPVGSEYYVDDKLKQQFIDYKHFGNRMLYELEFNLFNKKQLDLWYMFTDFETYMRRYYRLKRKYYKHTLWRYLHKLNILTYLIIRYESGLHNTRWQAHYKTKIIEKSEHYDYGFLKSNYCNCVLEKNKIMDLLKSGKENLNKEFMEYFYNPKRITPEKLYDYYNDLGLYDE